MGIWGPGPFESDEALDYVADVVKKVEEEMKEPSGVEDTHVLVTALAVRLAMIQHCHASPPDRSVIEALRDKVLAVYDDEIDQLQPAKGFKEARRAVIEKTFEDLLGAIEPEDE